MRLVCCVAVIMCTALLAAAVSFAGDVEPGASPGATMKSLQEIHDKVEEINAKMAGVVPVARTGQTETYYYLDDGWIQAGMAWPDPRFLDNGDGTVTDHLTGLVWLKNGNCTETVGGVDKSDGTGDWLDALGWTAGLADSYCGLSDGSVAGDWRLPSIMELVSLVDYGRQYPAFPEGILIENLSSNAFYFSSTCTVNIDFYVVASSDGLMGDEFWFHHNYYLAVRDAREGEQGGAP